MFSLTSPPTVPPSIMINVQADDLLCIRAGDPIRIPATIKGRPVPKVTWDFQGKAKSHKKKKLHTLPVDSQVRAYINAMLLFMAWQLSEISKTSEKQFKQIKLIKVKYLKCVVLIILHFKEEIYCLQPCVWFLHCFFRLSPQKLRPL